MSSLTPTLATWARSPPAAGHDARAPWRARCRARCGWTGRSRVIAARSALDVGRSRAGGRCRRGSARPPRAGASRPPSARRTSPGDRRPAHRGCRSTSPLRTSPSSRRVNPLGDSCSRVARSHIRMAWSAPRTGTRAPGSHPSSGRARRGPTPAPPSGRGPSRRTPATPPSLVRRATVSIPWRQHIHTPTKVAMVTIRRYSCDRKQLRRTLP